MATQEEVEKIQKQFDEITKTEIPELIYNTDWGSINFKESEADLTRLFALCDHFKVLPLDQLPSDIAIQITTEATPIAKTIENIRSFTIEQANPASIRDQYVTEIKTNVDRIYKFAHIYVPYLAYQKGEIQSNIKQLTKSVIDAKKLLDDAEIDVKKKDIEINKIIQAAREASASVGVAHFTSDFITEAGTLEDQAKNWLYATICLAVVSLFFAIYFLIVQPDLSTTARAIQYVSSKILILIILLTATLWCGNLYKAAKHQSAANRFKGNSLKTFQAFVSATEDDSIRDAVLMETTRAIFSESATGYLSSSNQQSDSTTKVIEIIRNSSQAASDQN